MASEIHVRQTFVGRPTDVRHLSHVRQTRRPTDVSVGRPLDVHQKPMNVEVIDFKVCRNILHNYHG